MSSVLIREVEVYPYLLTGRWEKGNAFVLTEYEKYGDDYIEISMIPYSTEKELRKAFSQKLYKIKKLVKG